MQTHIDIQTAPALNQIPSLTERNQNNRDACSRCQKLRGERVNLRDGATLEQSIEDLKTNFACISGVSGNNITCTMLCSSVFVVLVALLIHPVPGHARALHTPDKAMQVINQILERYNDLLTLDDLENLTSDQTEEPVQTFSSGLKVAEYPKWIDIPVQTENAWLRLLKGALASQKRAPPDRLRRGWNRGCFGLKLDRIGSMSGLGC